MTAAPLPCDKLAGLVGVVRSLGWEGRKGETLAQLYTNTDVRVEETTLDH